MGTTTDYSLVNPKIYTVDEIKQSINILQRMHKSCNRGDIDQHASPALLMAIDFMGKELVVRVCAGCNFFSNSEYECLLKECVK